MRQKTRIGILVIAVLAFTSACALSDGFPVRNAETAISIARQACQGKADASLTWEADLDEAGQHWRASTLPSIKKSGDPLFVVMIPVNGPLPACSQAAYDISILP